MTGSGLSVFPENILVDATKSHEAVFVHPDQSIYADASIAEAFDRMNSAYQADRSSTIFRMADAVKRHKVVGTLGRNATVNLALESDDSDADSDELLVVTSPLNDGRPKSSAYTMVDYVNTETPNFAQIALARPNSWGPITKLDVGFEVSKASGRPVPMLQLLSRVPPRAMSAHERRLMWGGDYTGYGRIALDCVRWINRLRRLSGKQSIQTVHFFGAGMAQRALGAAAYFSENQDEYEVGSATAMNLALNRGVRGASLDHMGQTLVKEPSGIVIPSNHVRIDEPQVRQDIDHRGSDTLQMYGRQLWAIKDFSYTIPFMTKFEPTVDDVETIMATGAPIRIVNGLNTGMNVNTLRHLPVGDPLLKYSTIVGIEGQKVGMMANEHAGVVAVAMSLGMRDYDQLRQAA